MQTEQEKREQVTLYVPWQDNQGNTLSPERFADLECLLGSRFEGFTKTMGDGVYLDKDDIDLCLQQEPVYVYTCLVPPGCEVAVAMKEVCQTVLTQWEQHEVWYTVGEVVLARNKED